MRAITFCSQVSRLLLGLLAISSLAPLGTALAGPEPDKSEAQYLFICAGDQARTNSDFLAVINFSEDSKDYGKVIASVPFAAPDATGNELSTLHKEELLTFASTLQVFSIDFALGIEYIGAGL